MIKSNFIRIQCAWLMVLVATACLSTAFSEARAPESRPRVIVTTDGEGDDQCSMVRFLLYANEWNLEGIVFTSSKHHWVGTDDVEGYKWLGTDWFDAQLDAYAEVYPNLKLHDPNYPTPEFIRERVHIGNILLEGDMAEATPGSDHIVEVLLRPDSSPVWLQAWGGPNTIARALKTIQEDHPERIAEVTQKARIFMIAQQDDTYGEYIQKEWPDLTTLWSAYDSYGGISYRWYNFQSEAVLPYFDPEWLVPNIVEGHGPLTARYPLKKGKYRSEGDSPTFLHLIHTGLRSAENPAWGGWGGRFARLEDGLWKSTDKEGATPHSILRWAIDFQHDWAARADWCVEPFSDANHPPIVALDHEVDRVARPGEQLELSAMGTLDPDGDTLDFEWWSFREASSYTKPITVFDPKNPIARIDIPEDASNGDTIHVVCTVSDNGTPSLTRYARVVITISRPQD